METVRILEIAIAAIMGVLVGFVIAKQYHTADIKDFQREAVSMECGFYNVNGEFDWKYPELIMVD